MKNTTLIYIEKDGKTLMLHRTKKKNDLNSDLWIGVGGHCEEDESPEECAVREAKEETGLTLTDYDYRGIVTFVSDKYEGEYMHLFTANGFEGEPGGRLVVDTGGMDLRRPGGREFAQRSNRQPISHFHVCQVL